MKRTLCAGVLLVLTAMTAACSFKIFEDIGSDPHPPSVTVTALVHAVAEAGGGADLRGRSIPFDSRGFTLTGDQKFTIEFTYADAGGDIVSFNLRDRDGPGTASIAPTGQTFFPGTSGAIPYEVATDAGVEIVDSGEIAVTGIDGRHRLEFWAEDDHGSRSEKVEFVVTVVNL